MANSVQKNPYGPFWPLGEVVVTTSGTPVNIMANVDPTLVNDPNKATTSTSAEYTRTCNQIVFQGVSQTAGAAPMVANTGNIYIIKRGAAGGSGNKNDAGVIVGIVWPGGGYTLDAAALNLDVFCPYDIQIDADVSGEGALVSMIIQ